MNLRILLLSIALAVWASPLSAQTTRYTVMSGTERVGHLDVTRDGERVLIDYDVKENGRGPTIREVISLGPSEPPTAWTITGTSTFLGEVNEHFAVTDGFARWSDAASSGEAPVSNPLYIAQAGSPWQMGVIVRALLDDADHRIDALPGGTLTLEEQSPVALQGTSYRAVLVNGISMAPVAVLMDQDLQLVAVYSSRGATIREGLESSIEQLYDIARQREAKRFTDIQQNVAHHFDIPVTLRNVRLFDPAAGSLSDPVSLTFFGNRITDIGAPNRAPGNDDVVIEGEGRIVIPGLHDMHAHLDRQAALLYIASGVTSVRDMGNDNAFLLDLEKRIEAGELAGPRIIRNGFLEGRSPHSSRNGFVVASQNEALDAVRWYADRGYFQIKIYNSMPTKWLPAIIAEANRHGMGVTGHVPAFTNADAVIAAGYGEITHINQLMLGWVLDPGEDTRTPLRLTAMKRTAGLDLDSAKVRTTIDTMVTNQIALDPTAVTLELLMLGRDGEVNPAVARYFNHLPIGVQRDRRREIASIASPKDDADYKGAFVKIKQLLAELHRLGIRLLPGTDDGTGLSLHRELQIYNEAGISPAEVLRLATLAPEQYIHRDQQLGTIERGKLADFVLLDGNPLEDLGALDRIAMVVKDGTAYFPSEIWPLVGVKPFADAPEMHLPTVQSEPADQSVDVKP